MSFAAPEQRDPPDRGHGHDLACPKCSGTMLTYLRNGVQIDQCRDCRGIFLDLGEFERLMAAETSFLGGSPSRV